MKRLLQAAMMTLALAVMLGTGSLRAAAATTITVDCTSDPSALAGALATATDGDTLAIQGTCKGTFEITHDVTLQSSGGATLDGQGAGPVLTIDSARNVILKSLTVSGGTTLLYTDGAGIYNSGTLTLTNSTVSGNNTGYAGNGGGIFNNGGTLTLQSSTVSGNSASLKGGGIRSTGGTLTLTNSAVSGNNSSFDGGGGIFSEGGTLTLSGTTIEGNTAGARGGGGVDNVSAELTLTNSTISDNTGGGIFNEGGTLTLEDSTVSGNLTGGGGIETDGGLVTLTRTTVSDNAPRGIFNAEATVTLTGSTVSGNSAPSFLGGGIMNRGTLTLDGTTVRDNSAYSGGGIDNFFYATMTVQNSTFTGNTGGAIQNDSYLGPEAVVIAYSTISGNSGGALSGNPMTLASTIVALQTTGGNCAALISDDGYNLEDGTSCGFSAANHSLSNTNPMLDPAGLQNNGGPTQTIALEPGSPAIDAIPVGADGCGTTLTTDQRGVSRPQGPGCDIGAFELVQETPAQLLAELLTAVVGVGPGTSLADKVELAQAYLSSNDVPDTCSTLNAFINEVKAEKGKKITPAVADDLIAQARRIEALLGC
jgi:nitrous oxidase accessory protein NosD